MPGEHQETALRAVYLRVSSSQERLLETLQAQVGADQRSLAQLEQTATRQMEGLTQQSSQALDVLQRRLGLASSQKEQLHAFVKVTREGLGGGGGFQKGQGVVMGGVYQV